jgi:uroporphyrinogen-III decarboxylase
MALDANPGTPRTDVKSRQYRTFTYQEVDRVPDVEFGYWPQTIRRWLAEGMDLEMTHEETENAFNAKVDRFLGFDDDEYCHGIGLNTGMDPVFEHEILERREGSVIQRDAGGVVAECFDGTTEESSIPHYISFPVETPDDWAAMKFRFDPASPSRTVSQETIDTARAKAAEGCYNTIFFCGPYAFLRGLMGFMNVSTAFYEFPDMIHDMLDTWTALCVGQIEQLGDTPIDHVNWWEDMASKNGPFVSPDMFREFIQPSYRAIMQAAKKRGSVLGVVDCDGDPHDIVANWMEEGVNIMFPLEVAAGVDAYAWREEFGMELRIRGAVAKVPLVQGGSAIDAEMERLKPLLDQGGFVPHLDHLVPPDISYDNYRYYLDAKRKLIGK